jgi:hypothetical protein
MKLFQIVMTIVATGIGLLAGAAMADAVHISADGISFLLAVSGGLATFGFQVKKIPVGAARACGAISLVIAAGLAAHWAFLTTLIAAHIWVATLMHWVGIAGALLGFIGRSPAPAPAIAPPAGPKAI